MFFGTPSVVSTENTTLLASSKRLDWHVSIGIDTRPRSVRMLNLIDEFTRECLMVRAVRQWWSVKVIGALADVMLKASTGTSSIRQRARARSVDLSKCFAETTTRSGHILPWATGHRTRDELTLGGV